MMSALINNNFQSLTPRSYLLQSHQNLEALNSQILDVAISQLSIESSRQSQTPIPQLKFLIVDDNAVNILILKRLLQKAFEHCIVDTFASPQQVLNHAFSSRNTTLGHSVDVDINDNSLQKNPSFDYDVLFFDIEMPYITGVELASRLRQDQSFDKFPIVAVTSRCSDEDKEFFAQSGIDLTVGKPLSSSTSKVIELVNNVLHSRE